MLERRHTRRRSLKWTNIGIVGGITAVFLGYLSVWIPGPAAGLQFIGIEVGEWLKFLGVGPIRNVFYFPPVTLGSIIILYSYGWSNGRWQSWLWRLGGCGVALLAFPAWEDLRGPESTDYMARVWMIGFVYLLFGLVTLLSRRQGNSFEKSMAYFLIAAVGIGGSLYPTWLYSEILATVSLIMGGTIGVGLGVWLNGMGHLAIAIFALYALATSPQ